MPFDDSTFLRREKEPGPYLRCSYVNGPFDEYFIGFTTTERRIEETPFFRTQNGKLIATPNGFGNHMFVKKEEIIILEDNQGLVNLFGFEEIDEENCTISIRDSANGNIPSQRNVPSSEIVWQ